MKQKCFPFQKATGSEDKCLFCFHHAGGSASCYRNWGGKTDYIEIVPYEFAGSGVRTGEEYIYQISDVARRAAAEIVKYAGNRGICLYGHSMGAAAAFLVCYELEHNYHKFPELLVVAGRHAPQNTITESYHTSMGMDKLEEELRRLGGTSEEVFEDEEIKRFILSKVMKSYKMNESFHYEGQIISAPVLAHCGRNDTDADYEMMKEWAKVTTGSFELEIFDGGHFFPLDMQDAYINKLIDSIIKKVNYQEVV